MALIGNLEEQLELDTDYEQAVARSVKGGDAYLNFGFIVLSTVIILALGYAWKLNADNTLSGLSTVFYNGISIERLPVWLWVVPVFNTLVETFVPVLVKVFEEYRAFLLILYWGVLAEDIGSTFLGVLDYFHANPFFYDKINWIEQHWLAGLQLGFPLAALIVGVTLAFAPEPGIRAGFTFLFYGFKRIRSRGEQGD